MAKAARTQDRGFWWVCGECRSRNYTSMKNRKNDPDRLKINKYCPGCRKHTQHRESAISARGKG